MECKIDVPWPKEISQKAVVEKAQKNRSFQTWQEYKAIMTGISSNHSKLSQEELEEDLQNSYEQYLDSRDKFLVFREGSLIDVHNRGHVLIMSENWTGEFRDHLDVEIRYVQKLSIPCIWNSYYEAMAYTCGTRWTPAPSRQTVNAAKPSDFRKVWHTWGPYRVSLNCTVRPSYLKLSSEYESGTFRFLY